MKKLITYLILLVCPLALVACEKPKEPADPGPLEPVDCQYDDGTPC